MRQLTTAEFQARMKRALSRFSSDWSRHRADEPGLFPDRQVDLLWWEAFSEFAQAEIFNEALVQDPPARA